MATCEELQQIKPSQKRTLENYKDFLLNFLPTGPLWKNLSETFIAFMEAWAVEFHRNDGRNTDLQTEVIPGLSVELLEIWESDVLVEDELPEIGDTIFQRQCRIHSKLFSTPNNPTQKFFEDLALNRVVVIDITFPQDVFRVSVNRVGDRLSGAFNNFIWIVDYVSGDKDEYIKLETTFRRLSVAWQFLIFNPPPP